MRPLKIEVTLNEDGTKTIRVKERVAKTKSITRYVAVASAGEPIDDMTLRFVKKAERGDFWDKGLDANVEE